MSTITVIYTVDKDENGERLPSPLNKKIEYDQAPIVPRIGEMVSEPDWEEGSLSGVGSTITIRNLIVKEVQYYSTSIFITLELAKSAKAPANKYNWLRISVRLAQWMCLIIGTGMIGAHLGMSPLAATSAALLIWAAIALEKPLRESYN